MLHEQKVKEHEHDEILNIEPSTQNPSASKSEIRKYLQYEGVRTHF
jgi:hypothetical protein